MKTKKKPGNSSAYACGHIERILKVFPEREISDRGFVMKKLLAVVLSALFVVAVAVPVLATDARQTALGNVGNYIEDDYNIFTWYGTLPTYSNTVWIGLTYDSYYYYPDLGAPPAMGSGYQPYIGASYALGTDGKYGTLAMFFNYYGVPLNYMNEGWDYYGDPYTSSLYSKWNVLYGYAMDKLSFGLYFSRSDQSTEYDQHYKYVTPDTTEWYDYSNAQAYTTVGAGVRFDIGEKMYADLAFDYSWASMTLDQRNYNYYSQYYGYGEITADANKMMDFRGRAFYEWNDMITLVPYVEFGTFDFSLKGDSMKVWNRPFTTDTLDWKDTNYGVKGTMIMFGLGANVKVNENNLLVFAVEPYGYYKLEQSDPPAADFVRQDRYYYPYYDEDPYSWGVKHENTSTALPVFHLALETDVRDWLTFRIGGEKGFYKDEYKTSYKSQYGTDPVDDIETGTETDTYTGSWFSYWMGLGFHVGDFDIDAVVNNNLPFRVGYWLTGYENNSYDGPPVYMLSAAYHF
jgi:hypothetical protein